MSLCIMIIIAVSIDTYTQDHHHGQFGSHSRVYTNTFGSQTSSTTHYLIQLHAQDKMTLSILSNLEIENECNDLEN